MNTTTAGAWGWGVAIAVLYFLPAINGYSKRHASRALIFVLNLFAGWTAIGWLVALAWSCSSAKDAPVEPSLKTHIPCPMCAEWVLRAARVCKHCGSNISREVAHPVVSIVPKSRLAEDPAEESLPEKWKQK